jgi:hypothetical protein
MPGKVQAQKVPLGTIPRLEQTATGWDGRTHQNSTSNKVKQERSQNSQGPSPQNLRTVSNSQGPGRWGIQTTLDGGEIIRDIRTCANEPDEILAGNPTNWTWTSQDISIQTRELEHEFAGDCGFQSAVSGSATIRVAPSHVQQ